MVPCFVIAIYASLGIWSSQKQVNQLSKITNLIELIEKFNDVQAVLPDELGEYLKFIKDNPAYTAFTLEEKLDSFNQQVAVTDQVVEAFKALRQELDLRDYDPSMQASLEKIDSELNRLPQIRSAIDDRIVYNQEPDRPQEWQMIEDYYKGLGGMTRTLIAMLVNEDTTQEISRKLLAFYKASEAFGHSLSAKGMVFWAIQVDPLPWGANTLLMRENTREKDAFKELKYYAQGAFRERIRDFIEAEPYQFSEELIEDIISKGDKGDYMVKDEDLYTPSYDHINSFEAIINDMKADLDQTIKGAISSSANNRNANILALFLSLGATLFISIVLSRSMILKPLTQLRDSMDEVASGDGDLTRTLEIRSKDEIAAVAGSFNVFLGQIRDIVVRMKGVTERVNDAGNLLVSTSENLSEVSSRLEMETGDVRMSSDNITTSSSQISEATDEISASLNAISTSVEELSSSINEIARNCDSELKSAADARKEMDNARGVLDTLNRNAGEIQSIVEIIDGIAGQTNLLALNATIEAASAGEAGKGFAVVANEVKELARQSSDATGKITQQVANIQKVTQEITQIMGTIGDAIDLLHDHSESIAAAAEEQSVTTNEISDSFTGVTASLNGQASHIHELSQATKNLSSSLERIGQITQTVRSESDSANGIAHKLNELQQENKELLVRFKT